ncbi:MAG: endonuclease/exonuclease/phosphatase family protein [Clostridia bacterium]|nr:endonuclease/exonuclease/phosphatase family protein [Clostridia bacterium]
MKKIAFSFIGVILCMLMLFSCVGCSSNEEIYTGGTLGIQQSDIGAFSESLGLESDNNKKPTQNQTNNQNNNQTNNQTNNQNNNQTGDQSGKQTDAQVTFKVRFSSYNIYHGGNNKDLTKIADNIKNNKLDIIGFEEVDNNTNRSGKVNQVKKLSELTGLKYYHFFKAINHDGGEYGLAILSKYPIESSNKINLSSPSSEQRILAHSVINVNGEKINFFVTHLSYDEESSNKGKDYREKQFNEIANEFAKHENFVLAGDFNTRYLDEYSVIKNSKLVNTKEAPQITYPDGRSPLDNLVYSTSVWTFDKINVVTNSYSDHYMIHSEATYTKKK